MSKGLVKRVANTDGVCRLLESGAGNAPFTKEKAR